MAKTRSKQNDDDEPIDLASSAFKMAGNPKALMILMHLDRVGEMNVGEMCSALGEVQTNMSSRLSSLRRCGLVGGQRVGKVKVYSLSEKGRILVDATKAMNRLE
jgi:DNA-binding transcriptional ArsR family regulator